MVTRTAGFMKAPARGKGGITRLRHEQACSEAFSNGVLKALNKIVEANGGQSHKQDEYCQFGSAQQLPFTLCTVLLVFEHWIRAWTPLVTLTLLCLEHSVTP